MDSSFLSPNSRRNEQYLLNGRMIQVVGHAGAGKSVFSERLGEILDVPVVHLDSIFWSKDWIKTPAEKAREIVRERINGDEWIVDGNQYQPLKDITYPTATDIIWIDPPFFTWLYRLITRAIKNSLYIPGSFHREFLNPQTSIIAQAFRLRDKKIRSWEKMIRKDKRWRRIENPDCFLQWVKDTR